MDICGFFGRKSFPIFCRELRNEVGNVDLSRVNLFWHPVAVDPQKEHVDFPVELKGLNHANNNPSCPPQLFELFLFSRPIPGAVIVCRNSHYLGFVFGKVDVQLSPDKSYGQVIFLGKTFDQSGHGNLVDELDPTLGFLPFPTCPLASAIAAIESTAEYCHRFFLAFLFSRDSIEQPLLTPSAQSVLTQ